MWAAARARLEKNGPQTRGRLKVDTRTRELRHAVGALLGLTVTAHSVTVELGVLDARLRDRAVAGGLTVALYGPAMAAIVAAIPVIAQQTGRPVIVVGGLAVLCRLSTPYRATTDLDTVSRLHAGQASQLELLIAPAPRRAGLRAPKLSLRSGKCRSMFWK